MTDASNHCIRLLGHAVQCNALQFNSVVVVVVAVVIKMDCEEGESES